MADTTDWDGSSELTTSTIVGAYGARAQYVGPSTTDGVIIVQTETNGVPLLIQQTALTVPDTAEDIAVQALADKITANDSSITSDAALAAAKALYAASATS